MLITSVVAPLLGASCYVLQHADGRCVVVDPGAGVAEEVVARVQDAGLRPLGVLLTHGHVDHTWSAALLSELWSVPVHVHEADAYRLADPFGSLGELGPQLQAMAAGAGLHHRVPERVETFGADGPVLAEPGDEPFPVRARHCPGHTEGSTTYLLDADGPVALTGDVLFAGTIGRTDLPGGDAARMAASLADLAALPPPTAVLPGHGPASTIGDELRSNPYLRTT